ncbi:uncharacterized protein [Clytia hemisphaerica]|uniref:Uncharacterized protein n=1 Tax=Clytia hemisphaerica TaxID=252671 RepID=A0A7M5X682_9CNID
MEKNKDCPPEIKEFLYTLTELCRLAYLPALKRNPRIVLRAYNITYRHAMSCNQIFGKNPKLTKFYGTYYHALTTHLAEVYKLISPSSLYTESEERIFAIIRAIVKATSSRTKESIRDIGLIRYQTEKAFEKKYGARKKEGNESRVS